MYRRVARINRQAPTNYKLPYIVFNPHTLPACVSTGDDIIITIIDPGLVNCAIRTSIYNIIKRKSTTYLMKLINFTSKKEGDTVHHYTNIFEFLEPFHDYFINSHYICIESQLPINYDLVRFSQHLLTYLMMITRDKGNRPLLIELDPRMKSRMLNAPSKMKKPQLKKWARDMGVYYLRCDDEPELADFLEKEKKGDDYGDVICYEKCVLLILSQGMFNLQLPA